MDFYCGGCGTYQPVSSKVVRKGKTTVCTNCQDRAIKTKAENKQPRKYNTDDTDLKNKNKLDLLNFEAEMLRISKELSLDYDF